MSLRMSSDCYAEWSRAVREDRSREACAIFGRLKRLERGIMIVLWDEELNGDRYDGRSCLHTSDVIDRLAEIHRTYPSAVAEDHTPFPEYVLGPQGNGWHSTTIKALKLLRDLGLVAGYSLYDYEECRTMGYGHCLTPLGYAVADLALKAGMKVQVREETL